MCVWYKVGGLLLRGRGALARWAQQRPSLHTKHAGPATHPNTPPNPTRKPPILAPQVADGYRPPLLPTLPESVKAVIKACSKGLPELRPTAREVVAQLEAIRDSGGFGRVDGR